VSIHELRCYQCGVEYGYIGVDPHPAQCPACQSSCVPPVGSLTVFDRSCWQNANGKLSKLWIHGVDERGRSFEFTIAARKTESKLVSLSIDDVVLDRPAATRCRIPPAIADEIAAAGIPVPDSHTVPDSTGDRHQTDDDRHRHPRY